MTTAQSTVRLLEDFLSGSRDALVLEEGAVAFDLASAKYSIAAERGKCLLHLLTAERNIVRRVVEGEIKNGVLRLAVQRLGQARPSKLEICRKRDRRTPYAKKASRSAYLQKLRRVLDRHCPGFTVAQLSSATDLERSFGPIYARGLLRQGRSAYAVLGVNSQEIQASIDAALTFGILWLDACRESQNGRVLVEGLKLFVPAGTSALTRERIAHLNQSAAKWQLFETEERDETLREIDCADRGNVATRLVHCPDDAAARDRFAKSIRHIRELLPECEVAVLSEIAFRWRGLGFAHARVAHDPKSFRSGEEIVFGVGAAERVLCPENSEQFADLVGRAAQIQNAHGPRDHPLWRLHPERWLESLVGADVRAIEERLEPASMYWQVPAFSASDRAMIDVLTMTREGRLAVVELKADEDIHFPLQGLDYWARVEWHHARGEFQRFGYFPGREAIPGIAASVPCSPGLARSSRHRHAAALHLPGN